MSRDSGCNHDYKIRLRSFTVFCPLASQEEKMFESPVGSSNSIEMKTEENLWDQGINDLTGNVLLTWSFFLFWLIIEVSCAASIHFGDVSISDRARRPGKGSLIRLDHVPETDWLQRNIEAQEQARKTLTMGK